MSHERIPLDQLDVSSRALDRLHYGPPPQDVRTEQCAVSPTLSDQEPDPAAERTLMHAMLASAQDTSPVQAVRGTVYPFVHSVLWQTEADWRGYFPYISRAEIAELSKHPAKVDIAAFTDITQRHDITNEDYYALQPRYRKHITELSPTYAAHFNAGVAEGQLSKPPYHRQVSSIACTASCFRMVYHGISGEVPPSEYVVESSILPHPQDTDSYDESLLFRSLSSPFFKNRTGRTVLNRIIMGATFDDIARRVEKVTQKYEGSDVYAMLAVKNFDDQSSEMLHAVMLLHADEDTVTFHNPLDRALCHSPVTSGRMGGREETLSREEFVSRWALGLYTAHLIYAMPRSA